MSSIKKLLIAASMVVMFSAVASSVKLFGMDESNWPTRITLDEAFQVGDLSLSPGTYEFYVCPSLVTRSVIMVYNVGQRRWEGMATGIYVSRKDTRQPSGFTFLDEGKGNPQRIEYWFYPEWDRGVQFIHRNSNTSGNMASTATLAASK